MDEQQVNPLIQLLNFVEEEFQLFYQYHKIRVYCFLPKEDQIKIIDKYEYSLSNILGKGSFGTVYLGVDTQTQTQVAIKVLLKKKVNQDPYLIKCFKQEIEILTKLNSDYIVCLLEVKETSNNYYIVQEFCDGGDFRSVLRKVKSFQEVESVQILKDILLGFKELLKKGVIHRDLKPENILKKQNTYKLADFGFARNADIFEGQILNSVVGTPLYMSPQLIQQLPYTSKCDIWSLGFIIYEMLYGKTPYISNSMRNLLKNIKTQPLIFPPQKKVSFLLKDLIKQCLQIEESDRIDWIHIYKHPVFNGFFNSEVRELEGINKSGNFHFNELKQSFFLKDEMEDKVHKDKNYSIDTIRMANIVLLQVAYLLTKKNKALQNSSENKIKRDQFIKFVQQQDQSLQEKDIICAFNLIDFKDEGEITYESLQNAFNSHFYTFKTLPKELSQGYNQLHKEVEFQKDKIKFIEEYEQQVANLKMEKEKFNEQQRAFQQKQKEYQIAHQLPLSNSHDFDQFQYGHTNSQQQEQQNQKLLRRQMQPIQKQFLQLKKPKINCKFSSEKTLN